MSQHTVTFVFAAEEIMSGAARAALAAALDTAADAANKGARARTVSAPTGKAAFEAPQGQFEADGGGVANSYGYRAESSRIGYAWWTDETGRLHVRVAGDRVTCSKSVACLFGGDLPAVCYVFPALRPLWTKTAEKKLGRAGKELRSLLTAVREAPQDAVGWSALADWIEELGGSVRLDSHTVSAPACRTAAEAALTLTAAPVLMGDAV